MANIADNLKRLLGTEGHNIQEVLENADSIGGGSGDIPMIEFTQDDDTWSIDKTTGIDDPEGYIGQCTIKFTTSDGNIISYIGNACFGTYGAIVFDTSTSSSVDYHYHVFTVSGSTVTCNMFNHRENI